MIAKAVHERQGKSRGEGLVIGGEDSLRVLGWIRCKEDGGDQLRA